MATKPIKTPTGKSTQDSLLINEIKDGVVVMRDGSLRGVILGSAINFDLMSQQEQNAIEFSFQGFLNGLHFPIQIVVRSQKIDLDAYIEKLNSLRNQQSNELLGILMDDYIANIHALIEEVNIMDKQFYVVVPYFPPVKVTKSASLVTGIKSAIQPMSRITVSEQDFMQYKKELSQRMAQVASGLSQMGIRALALGTQELVDLYYNWYNPDVAVNEKLIDASQLQTPVVTKGEGSAPRGTLPEVPL
jgi:type IV secretory pathway VirB4 component